ncbi:MAG: DUF1761 domain-containing protein [Parachlamydiales bacterium]
MVWWNLNYFPIIVAAIIYVVIGAIWYSPAVFGKLWMQWSDCDPDACKGKRAVVAWVGSFVVGLVVAWGLSVLIHNLGYTTFIAGGYVGILAWAGFVMTTQFGGVLWGGKHLFVWLIHAGCSLITLWVMGGIIASWV